MPACKPEAAAFRTVLDAVGADAASSIMFEDSLKNIRACRALGMRCVFIEEEVGGEAALLGDAARAGDADLYEAKKAHRGPQRAPRRGSGRGSRKGSWTEHRRGAPGLRRRPSPNSSRPPPLVPSTIYLGFRASDDAVADGFYGPTLRRGA